MYLLLNILDNDSTFVACEKLRCNRSHSHYLGGIIGKIDINNNWKFMSAYLGSYVIYIIAIVIGGEDV